MTTITKEKLSKYYSEQNFYVKDIAEIFKVEPYFISKKINEYGLIRNYRCKKWLKQTHHVDRKKICEMAKLSHSSEDSIRRWMKKHKIKMLNEIRYKNLGKVYNADYEFFETIDTEHKAYWLGFIMADGSILKKETKGETKGLKKTYGSYRLSVLLSEKDVLHLEKFKKDINYTGPIEHAKTILKGKEYGQVKMRITSNELCEDLIDKGVLPQHKSMNEVLPKDIPHSLKRHFIRGYFDGDGSFSVAKNRSMQPSITILGGKIFLADLKEFTIKYIVHTSTKIFDHNTYFTLQLGGTNKAKAFMDYIYKDATVFLDRKKEQYDNWLLEKFQ